MRKILTYLLFFLVTLGCREKGTQETLFRLVPANHHKIDFQNTVTETDSINILTLEYIYNGGGVAVADFNNDGLSDIFFMGNTVPNKLYLNKGSMEFEDVSLKAGIAGTGKWKSSAVIVDINNDGWQDIYICATIMEDPALRENMLFVHQGLDADGVPFFKEEAAKYGINDGGHSSGAAFFDYDNDGDLDLYVLTNTIEKGVPTSYRTKINDGSALNTDRLYRNNGDGTFTNVSKEAGIIFEGYGLGIAIADVNQDGWPDIYVSNDYISNDLLYINNQDGTFTNDIDKCIKHQSQFSMGNDIADINNDGLPDIITLDMLPEGNLRRKTVINGTSYTSYINNAKYGYAHQYIRNMLQLNNGNNTFSEIGQLANVHQTEWSWSPLFADFDNDGYNDLIITNGFPRDVTDKDFGNFRVEASAIATPAMMLDSIPVVKVANYAFRNNGDLTFSDVTTEWGMNIPSFSNGAAFADLDNDGDLDYIVNNINEKPFIFENKLYDKEKPPKDIHFLRIKLAGEGGNKSAFGTKITIFYDSGRIQYRDFNTVRGFISVVEDFVHFGLGDVTRIDSLLVQWPDGKSGIIKEIAADQVITIDYKSTPLAPHSVNKSKTPSILKDAGNIPYVHRELDKIDFNIQRTIPHKFSQAGPGISIGDVNGDGLEDIFIGGSADESATLFLQNKEGLFVKYSDFLGEASLKEEDTGALLFDADQDGDLDVYVVSGSIEYESGSEYYRDRLYINDGKGNFTIDRDALPDIRSSGLCVRAADFDGDGDLDLFVGGRVLPGQYPQAAPSFILMNEGGKFRDVTEQLCPEIRYAGMILDALWTDYDSDGKIDLLVAGEFMPLTIFKNTGNAFNKVENTGLENYKGWWNSLAAGDFDNDGDIDYVAGNLGLNNYYKASDKYPLKVFAKDIDDNNSVDAILACYFKSESGDMKLYPVHFWDELNSQSPKFRRKFNSYKQYGRTTMQELFTPEEWQDMFMLEANYMATSYIENLGNGKFKVRQLPMLAQVAPVNGMVVDDVNNDGHLDVLMVGNNYGNEVFAGRHDAFIGLLLLGDGRGNFKAVPTTESGFYVPHDAKALAKVTGVNNDYYLASQNRDSLKVFSSANDTEQFLLRPEALDTWAEVLYRDGKKQKLEFHYGSGYMSQSTRVVRLPGEILEITVYNSSGIARKIKPVR